MRPADIIAAAVMSSRVLRLHHRIVIPVVLVALVTTLAAAFVSQSLIRRALEDRVVAQLVSAAVTVSRSDFARNQAILDRVKEIAGADVITYTLSGNVLATTVTGQARDEWLATITAERAIASVPDGETVVRQMACATVPCYVVYRRVAATADTVVALVEEASELNAATQTMRRTILISAGLGLVVLVLAGQLVAGRVTKPLDRLVAFTREVSGGSTGRRAPVGDDEIGTLAGAFNAMLDRLETANRALVQSEKLGLAGLMAARVAHDIRNPLSSLKMQAQLLQSRVTSGEGQAMLQAVLHDIVQVESVVRGLLEFAKPGDVLLKPVQLNDVVAQVLGHMALQLTHRKITVTSALAADLPVIPLDADRFKQALLNVIANATEAMPGGGSLAVSTRLSELKDAVLLDVCDDGEGVDPAIADRLFDPFVSSKREGVGLGLVNTKSIVESHGGRVRLTPCVPRGTRVTMTLPLHAAPPASRPT